MHINLPDPVGVHRTALCLVAYRIRHLNGDIDSLGLPFCEGDFLCDGTRSTVDHVSSVEGLISLRDGSGHVLVQVRLRVVRVLHANQGNCHISTRIVLYNDLRVNAVAGNDVLFLEENA